MTVTLSRLRSFVVLAQTKSFAKTAKAVGRSQPAITDQIRTLEEALGVGLFHRRTRSVRAHPRKVKCCSTGSRASCATSMVCLSDFAKITALEAGEVRVGATPTLACYIVPEIIGSFRRKYPGIRIIFSDEPAAQLEAQVENRQLDFYFGPKPSLKSTLRFEFVAKDSYVIVVPKGHDLARRGRAEIRDLAKYPLLLMCRGTYVRDEIDQFLRKHRLHVDPVGEVSNHFTLGGWSKPVAALRSCRGLAYPVIAHPKTVALAVPDRQFARALGVATRRDYTPAPAAEAFLATMIPLVKKLLRNRPGSLSVLLACSIRSNRFAASRRTGADKHGKTD